MLCVDMDAPICRYDMDSRKTADLILDRMCAPGLCEDVKCTLVSVSVFCCGNACHATLPDTKQSPAFNQVLGGLTIRGRED